MTILDELCCPFWMHAGMHQLEELVKLLARLLGLLFYWINLDNLLNSCLLARFPFDE